MDKWTIEKACDKAPQWVWTTVTGDESIMLTNAFYWDEPESRREISNHVLKCHDQFLTESLREKIMEYKTIVYQSPETPFRPYIERMEVLRVGNKYTLLTHVKHLE